MNIEINNKRYYILILCLFLGAVTSYSQMECVHKLDGDEMSADSEYQEGIQWFPYETQKAMRNVQNFFDINVSYILAEDYDGICHEFNSSRGLKNATVTIGQDFLDAYEDDPLFIEILLAHEAAHTLQYIYGEDAADYLASLYGGNGVLKGKNKELQADVIAGFYTYYVIRRKYDKASSKEEKNAIDARLERSVGKFEAIADYQFTHANHHGRFNERVAAVSSGVNLAMYGFSGVHIGRNDFQGIYYTSLGVVKKWKSAHNPGGFKF
ncbi:hypothetical protein [Dokdonia sp.]|uniref:hypothetical protein n=1 Tax=Dokdonia sp. TaxID=2024995 RepID=UPI0032663517